MTISEIMAAIMSQPTVPLWPHAGKALGLSRNPTYLAAERGEIPTIRLGRKRPVPTAALRHMLGIEQTTTIVDLKKAA